MGIKETRTNSYRNLHMGTRGQGTRTDRYRDLLIWAYTEFTREHEREFLGLNEQSCAVLATTVRALNATAQLEGSTTEPGMPRLSNKWRNSAGSTTSPCN